MKTRAAVSLGLRVLILTFILFALYSTDFVGLSLTEEARTAPFTLLLVCLLHAAVLTYPILRSRWTGWRLVAAIFLVFYGVTTLMVAIEAVYLPEALPPDLVLKMVVNGAITAAVSSLSAVLIHGRLKSADGQATHRMPFDYSQDIPWTKWVGKFALIGISWTVLFIMFGALVFLPLAGRLDPAALEEYTNIEMPAWIIPFQALRAVIWAALTIPVIRMLEGARSQSLVVALLFSVLMGANLLRPLDMPAGLQIAHFVEVAGANFFFGWIVVRLLHRPHGRSAPAIAQATIRKGAPDTGTLVR